MSWVLAAAVVAVALAGCGAASEAVRPAGGDLTLEQAAAFDEFPLFFAGERVDGLPLVAIVRRDDAARYVSFVYGDCSPTPTGEGCAPPAEIQVWPRGRRPPELYDEGAPGSRVPERTRVRGVPAAFVEDGLRVELFTRAATVVIFGDSRARVLAIADALRCVRASGRGPPGGHLSC